VKLLITEDETEALRGYLDTAVPGTTSALAVVELSRTVGRRAPAAASAARELLARFELLELDRDLLETAATIAPVSLRTLDAIHLASALRLGDTLRALVTYDERLESAALAAGLRTRSPR
jgi:uncharacterized protein